jgi:hypothetical protein
MAGFVDNANGSLAVAAPVAPIDTSGPELWSGVGRLIDRAPDVDALIAHRIHLLAARRWVHAGEPIRDDLADDLRSAAFLALVAGVLLERIRAVCEGTILLFKGPETAAYYPEPSVRPFRDLDLLVPDAATAHDALLSAGFQLVGDERLFQGIHHLRPVVTPELPIVIEVHDRPKWVGGLRSPPVEELFEAAVPSATGVDGILTLPPAHHALLLAVHGWAHTPLRRLLDLVDVAAVTRHADDGELSAIARDWGLTKLWRTTDASVQALFYGDRTPMAMRIWARNLRSARERTVLEAHLERTLSAFWALPGRRALGKMGHEIRQHIRREPGESRRVKLSRSARALRNQRASITQHDRAVEASGLQAPSMKEVRDDGSTPSN